MSTNARIEVTFIGIGAIGLPMASQLHQAGYAVTGVDLFEPQRERAREIGLAAEEAPVSAATADIVIVMVATPAQLKAAVEGEQGVLSRMKDGASLIVMSTVGPQAVQDLAPYTAEGRVSILDVPVTGGVARAKTGSLTLFASGEAEVIEANREVLSCMGAVRVVGENLGDGQSLKAVNQLLCSVHIVAAAEALAFAEQLGLDPAEVLPAVESGAAGSWMLSDRGPRMLEGLDAEVTSTIGIFVKDSSMVADIAEEIGFDAPLVRAAQQRYLAAKELGLDRNDDSQVIQTYRKGE
ncbi:MAG TPA: nucleotide sugar dehydrogenase [Corynebacterium stationis]|nr:nucleotide sugar dehydrogenase [Corynebacterium stationis]